MLLLIPMEYFPIRQNYYTYFLQKYLNKIFWLQYYCNQQDLVLKYNEIKQW